MDERLAHRAEVPVCRLPDGRLDLEAFRAAALRLIGQGASCLTVCGTYASYRPVDLQEQERLLTAALKAAEGRVPVAMGALDAGTEKAADRVREHAALGCHLHICAPSFYFSMSHEDELLRHFAALHAADPKGRLILLEDRSCRGDRFPEGPRQRLLAEPWVAAILSGREADA